MQKMPKELLPDDQREENPKKEEKPKEEQNPVTCKKTDQDSTDDLDYGPIPDGWHL